MESPSSDKGRDRSPTFVGLPMKYVSLGLMVAQACTLVVVMRASRTTAVDGPRYLNSTAVFWAEVLKLLCSFVFLGAELGGPEKAWQAVLDQAVNSPRETVTVIVPSLLYTVQNNLLFIALSNLSVAVYQVTYQLKILTTAVLSVLILGRSLSSEKWSALVMLTVGVAVIQLPKGDTLANRTKGQGNALTGFSAVLAAAFTSGLAGVYLEKLLKQTDSSIWLRNIQLAFCGSALALSGCFLQDSVAIFSGGFHQGYSWMVWFVILLQAVGGLVVASVLKYADNILKCFGCALSIVISCIMSSVLLEEFTPDSFFLLGTLLVLQATALYSLGWPRIPQGLLFLVTPQNKARSKDVGEELI